MSFDEHGSHARLGTELVELDPEEEYPQAWEVWADVTGSCLELKTAGDVAVLQQRVHEFLQGLAPLSGRLADVQAGADPMRGVEWGAGFFGPERCAQVPGDTAWTLAAQLFWGDSASCMPVVSFCSPGLAADMDAAQTREFAMQLHRMADDADALAACLDRFPHPDGTAAVGTTKAV
ncbi:hypothetical protein ACFCWD_38570 [Streptomyces sp. NPDC056374]|uniref:hypothetical protein n=1 Tax=unclassified Streptomyces TaxID=2593676 RepID=UPI0035DBF18F